MSSLDKLKVFGKLIILRDDVIPPEPNDMLIWARNLDFTFTDSDVKKQTLYMMNTYDNITKIGLTS